MWLAVAPNPPDPSSLGELGAFLAGLGTFLTIAWTWWKSRKTKLQITRALEESLELVGSLQDSLVRCQDRNRIVEEAHDRNLTRIWRSVEVEAENEQLKSRLSRYEPTAPPSP